jgi:hypothetical protein
MLILAGAAAGVLLVGFFVTYFIRLHSADRLAAATATHAAAPPLVDVVTVRPAPQTDALALPGEAAAWQESTIYARVDGYVGKWFVDIGDHVHEGQVLATIETPTLDAQLVAAQARLRAAAHAVSLGGIAGIRRVHVPNRLDDRLPVAKQEFARAEIRHVHDRVKRAEIQNVPGERRSHPPDEDTPRRLCRPLESRGTGQRQTGEEVGGRRPDTGGGAGKLPLGLANIRPAPQQVERGARGYLLGHRRDHSGRLQRLR